MNRRLLRWFGGVLLLLLAYGLWLYVAEHSKIAELSLAALSQPREEMVIKGYVRNVGAQAFSLEKLLIEEPGKQPYERQVSLDADRKFELALSKPVLGNYTASVWTRSPTLRGGVRETWLKLPPLAVTPANQRQPQSVEARQYDARMVAAYAVVVLIAAAVWMFLTKSRAAKADRIPAAPAQA